MVAYCLQKVRWGQGSKMFGWRKVNLNCGGEAMAGVGAMRVMVMEPCEVAKVIREIDRMMARAMAFSIQ